MLEHIRASGLWFYVLDKEKNQQINMRLSAVRQEMVCPLVDPVVVVSFGSFIVPLKGDGTPPTEADASKCTPYTTADGDTEIIMLFEPAVGTNPALLFERCATVVTEVLLGGHRPMSYLAYKEYQSSLNKVAGSKLQVSDDGSPTGQVGVWDVRFTRTFGVGEDRLFSKLSSLATYRAGYVNAGVENIGGLYNFPTGFELTSSVEGVDFLEVMTNLLAAVKVNGTLAQVESYRIR